MSAGPLTRKRLALGLLGCGVLALGVFAFARGRDVSVSSSDRVTELRTAAVPEACEINLALALPQLMAQPAFAKTEAASVALAGALGHGRDGQELVRKLARLTQSESLSDVSILTVCMSRDQSEFAAALSGDLKRNALEGLAGDGWELTHVEGLRVLAAAGRRPPFVAQARDGSLLLASTASVLARAVRRSLAATEPARVPGGSALWASLALDGAAGRSRAAPGAALGLARRVTLQADFDRRTLDVVFELSGPGDTEAFVKNLKTTLETVAKAPLGGKGETEALSYLAKRARVRGEGGVVRLETELADAATQWLAEQVKRRVLARPPPQRAAIPSLASTTEPE